MYVQYFFQFSDLFNLVQLLDFSFNTFFKKYELVFNCGFISLVCMRFPFVSAVLPRVDEQHKQQEKDAEEELCRKILLYSVERRKKDFLHHWEEVEVTVLSPDYIWQNV